MADVTEKPPLIQIIELFQSHGVEFIVIGGQAAVLHGSPIPTLDVDLSYRRTKDNLQRLAAALKALNPTLRGAPPDLPFQLDAQSLALGSNFTFDTSAGPLDLLGWVEPLGTYDDFVARSITLEVAGFPLRVISLDDLIAIKRHLSRPKDQLMLVQLEAIQRLRAKGEGP
jgi:predicted nucleotidyltransferase